MKKPQTFLKVLMFLLSLLTSLFLLGFGMFYASPVGLFGAPNSTSERTTGLIFLLVGLISMVLSFLLFKKNFSKVFKILMILISVLALVSYLFLGFGQDIIIMYVIYAVPMMLFYKKIRKNEVN